MITEENKWMLWAFPILKTYTLLDKNNKHPKDTKDNYQIAYHISFNKEDETYTRIVWTNRLICYKFIEKVNRPDRILDRINLIYDNNDIHTAYAYRDKLINENTVQHLAEKYIEDSIYIIRHASVKSDIPIGEKDIEWLTNLIKELIAMRVSDIIRNSIARYIMEHCISMKEFIKYITDDYSRNNTYNFYEKILFEIERQISILFNKNLTLKDVEDIIKVRFL